LRIALFITCVADTLFPEVGQATVRVLERLGHEVTFPEDQTCCGQMHLNAGYRREADRLGRRFRSIFGEYDAVVSPSSSCVGTVRESLGMDNVYELSELLVHKLGVENVGARFAGRVAYHPTCHSLRVTKVGDAPLRLLRHVRALELVEQANADDCCGFGGTFAIKNSDTSAAMLEDKCDALERSGARWCTALDGSCLLHIGGGLSRRRSQTQPIHLAEILASR
jgi:L-lactate dehydrogenase complex protein LldE